MERGDRSACDATPHAANRPLDHRIDMGVRTGRLTRQEAFNLRAEFRNIANVERHYRRNGLNMAERRDLDRRFDRLEYRLYAELNDRQRSRRFG